MRLYRRSCQPEFHNLPAFWLLNIVRDLKDNESTTKLCATRRSAGLPFIFQVIKHWLREVLGEDWLKYELLLLNLI